MIFALTWLLNLDDKKGILGANSQPWTWISCEAVMRSGPIFLVRCWWLVGTRLANVFEQWGLMADATLNYLLPPEWCPCFETFLVSPISELAPKWLEAISQSKRELRVAHPTSNAGQVTRKSSPLPISTTTSPSLTSTKSSTTAKTWLHGTSTTTTAIAILLLLSSKCIVGDVVAVLVMVEVVVAVVVGWTMVVRVSSTCRAYNHFGP